MYEGEQMRIVEAARQQRCVPWVDERQNRKPRHRGGHEAEWQVEWRRVLRGQATSGFHARRIRI